MIAVLGAGPHGKQLAELYNASLFDDFLVGYESCLEGARHRYLIGAAWPKVRRRIAIKVGGTPLEDGIVVFPHASIGLEAVVGPHTHIGYNAVITHGVTLGAFVNICPGAVVSGEAHIGDGVFIGANATVIHGGLKIGDGAIVGAGSVVINNIPAGEKWAGNPARRVG